MQVVPMNVIRSFSFYIFILSQSTLQSEWPLSLILSIYYSKPRKVGHFFVLYILLIARTSNTNILENHKGKFYKIYANFTISSRARLKTGYCLLNTFVSLSK